MDYGGKYLKSHESTMTKIPKSIKIDRILKYSQFPFGRMI
jgi:hypothetical protein